MIEITVIDTADQQFSLILSNSRLSIRLRYSAVSDRWSFDLAVDDEMILIGKRIVTGVDLLQGYDLGLGVLFALGTNDVDQPGREELPAGVVKLYHVPDDEVIAWFASPEETG